MSRIEIRGGGIRVIMEDPMPAVTDGRYRVFLQRVEGRFDPSQTGWMATVKTEFSSRSTFVWSDRGEALTQGEAFLQDMKREAQEDQERLGEMFRSKYSRK